MKSAIYFRKVTLTFTFLCAASGASALALGKARGVAVLGQPLVLTVPVELGAAENESALCFDADVLYGDNQQERSRVSVSFDQSQRVSPVVVRVTAQARIDEPVVTVYLSAGCQHKVSRKYVLLTEVASDAGVASTPIGVSAGHQSVIAGSAPVDNPHALVLRPSSKVSTSGRGGNFSAQRRGKKMSPPAEVNPASAEARMPAPFRIAQRARLKLTPLDLRIERDPVLKSSDVLFDLPIEDLQKRAQAVATWKALNATPEDVLRQDTQLLALDGSIKSLGELTIKNQGALIDLTTRLEKAQAERYRNPLIYSLLAGLAVCLCGMAYLWVLLRRQNETNGPWWRGNGTVGRSDATTSNGLGAMSSKEVAKADIGTRAAATNLGAVPSVPNEAGVDIDLEARESAFARLVQDSTQDSGHSVSDVVLPTAAPLPGHRDFSYSVNATLRAINTQEMLDERQQAEFFMTLGQHEDAIHLLEDSIHHNEDANPLVYLDLLKMLHTLSRKTAYEQYRDEFNAVFSGRVPHFAQFSVKGHGLDAYTDVCQHIAALWPTEDALHFIEECLVRTHDGLTQEFDLDAFRDLLTLHGVLLRIFATPDKSNLVPFSTFKTQALSQGSTPPQRGAVPEPFTADQTMPLAASVQGVASVDLDLSESSNLLEFEEMTLVPADPPTVPK